VALPYPPAERVDVVDVLHGREVRDPYRWLEDVADPRTVAWREQQDALCRSVLDALPGRDRLEQRLAQLLRTGAVGVPALRSGTAFWTRRDPEQEHGVLRCRTPDGTERVLLDPAALDPSGLTTLDAWSPSKEGHRVALQVSTGGDEESRLTVLDVATGEVLDGPVDRCRYSPVAWVPDGDELYYVRRLAPDAVPAGEEQFHRRVWRHRVGTPPDTDELVWGEGLDPTSYYGCSVSPDGRWLLVTASAGTAPRDDVWLFDRTAGGPPAQVQVGVDARCAPWVDRDGRLWLLTDREAPRGRLCTADPQRPREWTTVLPEDDEAVLEDVVLCDGVDGPVLVVLRTRHAVSEVALHDLDGRRLADVALPGVGSVSGLSAAPEGGPDAWLGWTTATVPPQVLHLDVRTRALTTWAEAPGRPSVDVHAQLLETTSADGTTVRMQVLSASPEPDRPRPTVLYGYGGFGVSLTPAYTASALAWVEAGGTWVVANLRGGSEEGEAWHRAGMREHKQDVFDDYAACADALVAGGWTTPEQLGLYGGSNGGLLVGAALTQRPEACAAVVCSAPLLDMVRYERFGLGRTWNDEYGTAESPEELGWLLSYSPYHAVRDGTRYPAVLFTVFDGDSRVDPLHARKLCAALQAATAGDGPVLLRDERGVGHGARSVSRTVGLSVDVLAFLARHTGLEP
jgi:prolyl oligopeptidase